MADAPTDAAVRRWAKDLSDGALRCRTMPSKHQPIETRAEEVELEGITRRLRRVFVQHYRCRNNCGCTWQEMIDAKTGIRYSLQIFYPAEARYLAPHGFGRISSEQLGILRLERINRQLAKKGTK